MLVDLLRLGIPHGNDIQRQVGKQSARGRRQRPSAACELVNPAEDLSVLAEASMTRLRHQVPAPGSGYDEPVAPAGEHAPRRQRVQSSDYPDGVTWATTFERLCFPVLRFQPKARPFRLDVVLRRIRPAASMRGSDGKPAHMGDPR